MIAAKCVVFIPGAAQMSNVVLPGEGFSIHEDKQLACNIKSSHKNYSKHF